MHIGVRGRVTSPMGQADNTYCIWETVCGTEKIVKQKMQDAESFVATPSAKRGGGKEKK